MNSGPLSERQIFGIPRQHRQLPPASRLPLGCPAFALHRMARRSQVNSSIRVSSRKVLPVMAKRAQDEIVTPNMVRSLRPQPNAGAVVQPQASSRVSVSGRFRSPSRRQNPLHSVLTHRPSSAIRNSAVIRRYPYRPYWLASVDDHPGSSASSSLRRIGAYRCVPRPCPSSRQACRSLNPYRSACMPHRTTAAARGLEVSLCHIPQNLLLQNKFHHQPLEFRVLSFQFFQSFCLVQF